MRRFLFLLRFALVAAVLMAGYLLLHPSDSVASAYPTALNSFDAPTAWQGQCQFPRHCNGQTCLIGHDQLEGCKFTNQTCLSCFI